MLFLRVPCRSAHFQLHTVPNVFGRGQPHFQPDRLSLRIRINLHTGQMQRFFRFQENVADDAVPIRLCGFRIGMGRPEQLRRHGFAIVHPDGYFMPAGREKTAEVVHLAHGNAVPASGFLAVHPHASGLRTFQSQCHDFIFPTFRYVHHFLIPSLAHISVQPCEISGFVRPCGPESFPVRVCRSRKHYFLGKRCCGKTAFFPVSPDIQLECPFALQVHPLALGKHRARKKHGPHPCTYPFPYHVFLMV